MNRITKLMRQAQTLVVGLLTAVCMLAACSPKPPTPEELYKDEASGVVMVLNKFYYNASMPNGEHLYFTGIAEDGSLEGLTDDVNEVRRNCGYLTGTAFFIDDKGTLLTNRHVASPTIDEAQVKQCLMNMIEYVKALYEARMSELTSQYNALEAQKSDCVTTDYWGYTQIDQMRVSQIENQQNALQQQFSKLAQERSNLDAQLDVSSISIHPICQMGIAYNDSYVTTEADFLQNNPCNTLRIAQDKDTDLALIQLRSGLTPKKCHIFAVDGSNTNGGFWNRLFGKDKAASPTNLKIDQPLYMIGFNAGIVLANTRKGIKVQMTSGRITQMPDGNRLLYSIPTMQGSSGSPVVNEWGDLVGVNFAKLNGSDNFNFGIPLQKVRNFVGE